MLDEAILLKIFKTLDSKSVVMVEMVCHRWKEVIYENIESFTKISMDQVRRFTGSGFAFLDGSKRTLLLKLHSLCFL